MQVYHYHNPPPKNGVLVAFRFQKQKLLYSMRAHPSCPVWCVSVLGTVLFYQPGLLSGGPVEHECNAQRSIGYYLEALLMLAPFMKSPLKATLRGVTNDPCDPTVRNT